MPESPLTNKTIQPESPDWHRTLYNLGYRILGSRSRAKKILRAVTLKPGQSPLVAYREALRALLPAQEFQDILFSRGHEIVDTRALSEDLPHLGESFDSQSMELHVKNALNRHQNAVLELLLVDRLVPGAVAEALCVPMVDLIRFLTGLVVRLGRLDSYSHRTELECPRTLSKVRDDVIASLRKLHGASLGTSASPGQDTPRMGINPEMNLRPDATLIEEHPEEFQQPGCRACQQIEGFTQRIFDMLGRDSRIVSFSDAKLIDQALRQPRRGNAQSRSHRGGARSVAPAEQKSADQSGPSPVVPPTRSSPGISRPDSDVRLWAAGGALASFFIVYVTVATFGGFFMSDQAPANASFQHGLTALTGSGVGTYTDLTGESGPLKPGTLLEAPGRSPVYLNFNSGVQVVLAEGGRARIGTEGLTLVGGRVRVTLPRLAKTPFTVEQSDLVARAETGEFEAIELEASRARLLVRGGHLDAHDESGRSFTLVQGEVLLRTLTGRSHTVESSKDFDQAAQGD